MHQCGGSLITAKDGIFAMVSAAHCFPSESRNDILQHSHVRMNFVDLNSTNDGSFVYFDFINVTVHPKYDIAVVSLKPWKDSVRNLHKVEPIQLNRNLSNLNSSIKVLPSKPIEAPLNPQKNTSVVSQQGPLYQKIYVAGWGVSDIRTFQPSRLASKLQMSLTEFGNCDNTQIQVKGFADDELICAIGQEPSSGTCFGDSGGPLFVNDKAPSLIGLVSASRYSCAGMGNKWPQFNGSPPNLFTRIDVNLHWISKVVSTMKATQKM
ncbi:hypothetical protein MIR68_012609 [Amoeboaphelidium protococcarum]|nr:hypothetical protein MIR68_012609 [Amoeboaphelidium protococcarum]